LEPPGPRVAESCHAYWLLVSTYTCWDHSQCVQCAHHCLITIPEFTWVGIRVIHAMVHCALGNDDALSLLAMCVYATRGCGGSRLNRLTAIRLLGLCAVSAKSSMCEFILLGKTTNARLRLFKCLMGWRCPYIRHVSQPQAPCAMIVEYLADLKDNENNISHGYVRPSRGLSKSE